MATGQAKTERIVFDWPRCFESGAPVFFPMYGSNNCGIQT